MTLRVQGPQSSQRQIPWVTQGRDVLQLSQLSLGLRSPLPGAGFLFSLEGNANWLLPELARADGPVQFQSPPEGQSWAKICGNWFSLPRAAASSPFGAPHSGPQT